MEEDQDRVTFSWGIDDAIDDGQQGSSPYQHKIFTFDGWFELFTMTTILVIVVVAIRKKTTIEMGR